MKRSSLVLVVIFFLSSIALAEDENSIIVVGYVGKAEVKIGQKWKRLYIDDKISTNSIIRVNNKDDFLDILLPDGSVSRVIGNTEIKVSDLLKKHKIKEGEVVAKLVEKTGVAGVRGGFKPKNLHTKRTTKIIVKGYAGNCMAFVNGVWTNVTYNMELDPTNIIKIASTNDLLKLETRADVTTNLYGPCELELSSILCEEVTNKPEK